MKSALVVAVAAVASIVSADEYGEAPQQIHLAYAGAEAGTGMTMSWATAANASDSTVWIGTSKDNLKQQSVTVSSISYYSDENYTMVHHHATVDGLTPHTEYYYKVGSANNESLQSDVFTFTTARSADDTDEFTIAIYGDGGDGENSIDTIALLNTLGDDVDFAYHIGDISYADNDYLEYGLSKFNYEAVWNNWTNSLAPLMNVVPYMVLPGNHEAECHSPACMKSTEKMQAFGNYTAFNARFKMPSEESGGVLSMWYSFDYGPIHFISLSSETDYEGAPTNAFTDMVDNGNFGDQLKWLEADLQKASNNTDNVPWIFVGMHRPIYCLMYANKDGSPWDQPALTQAAFEDLFITYGVDLVLAGHQHSYERQFPIAKNKAVMDGVSDDYSSYTNPKAPVYIVTGAAGNTEGLDKNVTPNATWNVYQDNQNYGITTIKVSRTSLEWKFFTSDDQTVLDKFVLSKSLVATGSGSSGDSAGVSGNSISVVQFIAMALVVMMQYALA